MKLRQQYLIIKFKLDLPNNVTVSGNLTVNGNTDLGNATSDTITVTGRFDSALVPSADDQHDLGTSALGNGEIYSLMVQQMLILSCCWC